MSEAINNMSEANNAGIYLPGAPPRAIRRTTTSPKPSVFSRRESVNDISAGLIPRSRLFDSANITICNGRPIPCQGDFQDVLSGISAPMGQIELIA